ncbi:hypothetical protein G6F59_018273 [Rhizopus arrhizus]|nr:hypothetical protein G6F59_018273 [Rhizopus arrhizus]
MACARRCTWRPPGWPRCCCTRASSAGPGARARMRPTCASAPGWRRWTSSASPPATPCTRCRSPLSRWPTTRGWRRCWCRSPLALRCRDGVAG